MAESKQKQIAEVYIRDLMDEGLFDQSECGTKMVVESIHGKSEFCYIWKEDKKVDSKLLTRFNTVIIYMLHDEEETSRVSFIWKENVYYIQKFENKFFITAEKKSENEEDIELQMEIFFGGNNYIFFDDEIFEEKEKEYFGNLKRKQMIQTGILIVLFIFVAFMMKELFFVSEEESIFKEKPAPPPFKEYTKREKNILKNNVSKYILNRFVEKGEELWSDPLKKEKVYIGRMVLKNFSFVGPATWRKDAQGNWYYPDKYKGYERGSYKTVIEYEIYSLYPLVGSIAYKEIFSKKEKEKERFGKKYDKKTYSKSIEECIPAIVAFSSVKITRRTKNDLRFRYQAKSVKDFYDNFIPVIWECPFYINSFRIEKGEVNMELSLFKDKQ